MASVMRAIFDRRMSLCRRAAASEVSADLVVLIFSRVKAIHASMAVSVFLIPPTVWDTVLAVSGIFRIIFILEAHIICDI